MIFIYWTNTSKVQLKEISSFLKILSLSDQNKYFRFKRSEDSRNFLFGRYLLHLLLKNVSHIKATVSDIALDQYNRPIIPSNIPFSISHSENYVAVALLTKGQGKLGLDLEKIRPVRVEDYMIAFTDDEKLFISNSDGNQLNSFFDLWTRKESFLKALGEGFLQNPKEISVLEDQISYKNKLYYLWLIDIKNDLKINICCDIFPVINHQEINTFDF